MMAGYLIRTMGTIMGQEAEERTMQSTVTDSQPAQPQDEQETPPASKSRPSRINSPEQIDDYIRVTTPGMWLLVVAIITLLAAGIIWAYSTRIEMRTVDRNGQVMTEYVKPASFLTQ